MTDKLRVSVVMPTFNEEKALPLMVESIRRHTAAYDTEILIVDSSKDDTPVIAERLGVRVISQPPRGHGIALRAAITSASGDFIVTSDCDDTYPMEKVPRFVELLSEGSCDIVSGNRMAFPEVRRAMPAANLWANRSFAFIVRLFYGIPTHDVTTGMFGLKRSLVHAIDWETNYSFPSELIIRSGMAGYRYHEEGIGYRLRVGEVTLNRWRSGKAYLRCFLKYRFGLSTPADVL